MSSVTSKEPACCSQTSGQKESLRCLGGTFIQRSEPPTGSDSSKLAPSWRGMQPNSNTLNERECKHIAGFVIQTVTSAA